MKLKYLFTAVLALGTAFSALAQEEKPVDVWEYADNYWFAGAGAGLNVGFDGHTYTSRTEPYAGTGLATEVYVGKWFNSLAGFRAGWQGLTISNVQGEFGKDKYNYFHGDILLRPLSFFVPYVHAGYLKIDKGNIAGGVGAAFPIHVSKRLAIVPDLKYTLYNHKVWEGGQNFAGKTLSATIGLSFNLSGKKVQVVKVVPVTEYVDRERIVRDTVYIEKIVPDVAEKTAEVNEFLQNVTLFDWDSYALTGEAKVGLDKVVEWMQRYPNVKAKIEGHTDNTGTPEYNQKLSENRAKAVYDYLVEKGISADKLSYEGFGQTRPVATNDTWEGRHQNRRIEMIFSLDD